MAKKIYLSPSNQDGNTYATGNTNEMAQCDKIAKATATALRRCGFDVKVGKSGDGMAIRCRESDAYGADIHMPIHTNAYNGKVTGGTRIFCYSSSKANKAPAEAVLKTLGAISPGTADSVTVNAGLYEVNVPKAITVYVECEFHDTKTGSDWIRSNIDNIGEAICKGMCDYFGVAYKEAGSTTSKPDSKPATTTSKEMYRVGSAWKNGKCVNQKGAFESLANAKTYCDKYADYSVFDSKGNKVYTSAKKAVTGSFKSYKVTITSSNGVNIRKGAGTNYAVTGSIPKGGAYTIVAESSGQGAKKWGKLKSGAGWIALDYTKKI